jgi:MoxR-like ATPase
MSWEIFARTNTQDPDDRLKLRNLPPPPRWRAFSATGQPTDPDEFALKVPPQELARGANYVCSPELAEAVNAALYLRRPLLLTGNPGTGKSTLIEAVARELRLGPVQRWAITSRSTLRDGLYSYDALGRLNERKPDVEAADEDVGRFVELGPLGTALYPTSWPRALLIDEIDKSDLDLPNDLLNVFEEGEVNIPELTRHPRPKVEVRLWRSQRTVAIEKGKFVCRQFPFVVLTSNGERTFPGPFLRRCIQFTIPDPKIDQLKEIVTNRLGSVSPAADALIGEFDKMRAKGDLATDQLLNAIFLTLDEKRPLSEETRRRLQETLLKELAQK